MLVATAACAPTEPEPEPLAVRATLSAPVSSDTYAAGAVVERAVHLLRARLPAADSTVLRVTFRIADDATYEPARVIAVRTAPRTVY